MLTATPDADVAHYFDVASRMLAGDVPYDEVYFEYPPGALGVVLLPRLIADDVGGYARAFAAWAALAELVTLLGVLGLVDALLGRRCHRARRTAALAFLALTACLGLTPLLRLDAFVAASLVWGLRLALGRRHAALGDALLAAGAVLKLAPLLVVPAVLLVAWRRDGPAAALRHAARFALASALLIAPFALVVGADLGSFLAFHAERGLQVESGLGSLLVLLHALAPFGLQSAHDHGAVHLVHPIADALATATPWLAASGVAAVLLLHARRSARPDDPLAPRRQGVEGALLSLLAALLLGKVLSPQFLVWLLPLIAALVPTRRGGERVFWLALAASALTWLGYPVLEQPLANLHGAAALVVVARNAILLALIGIGLRGARVDDGGDSPATWSVGGRPRGALAILPWLLFAAWLVATNLYPVLDVDIWFHLRVGRDILLSGEVPRVDVYSATAAGRPFVAHAWLADVLLARIHDLTLGDALPWLRVWAVGMTATALLLAVPEEERWGLPSFLLTTLGLYLISAHAAVRPYLLSIFFASLVALSLEVWRRRRSWLHLAGVVPLVGLWANLHGAFLLAPALLLVAAAGAALQRRLGGGVDERPLSGRDALSLVAVALASCLAALLNPYGLDLYAHVGAMFFENRYIHERVGEWMPSLSPLHANGPWYWLQLAFAGALVAGLLARARRLPVVDALLAAAVLALWLKAVRFAPYLVVFGLPIAVRALGAAARDLAPRLLQPRPWVATSLAGTLLFLAVALGVGYRSDARVPLGLGVERPLTAVGLHHLRQSGARGAVFNDYEDGAYLVYAGPPDLFPVIDGRIDVYGAELVEEYFSARESGEALRAYLERHRVTAALFTRPDSAPLAAALRAWPDWREVAAGPGFVAFSRGGVTP